MDTTDPAYQQLGSGPDTHADANATAPTPPHQLGHAPQETPAPGGKHEDTAHHHDFGDKSITFWGSCVLNFNNITGPAVIVLPLLFQQAGWLLPCAGLVLMWLVSSFAATMLTESMQRIPGNHRFQRRIEYCDLVQHYFGKKWYLLSQIGFNAGLTASNILSMVISAQVLDAVFTRFVGSTYAVSYASWPPELLASVPGSSAAAHGCTWGITPSADNAALVTVCNSSVISVGYLLAMAVCMPMAYLNLEDNMGFQWASMLAQLLCSLQFASEFLLRVIPGTEAYCPGTGPRHTPLIGLDTSQVVGVCVFAFSYVSTIPSWANEKKPGVSVNKAVWLPASVGVALNILLGLLGAWAFSLLDFSHPGAQPRPYSGTDDILNLLDGQADSRVFTCDWKPGQTQRPYTVSWLTELSVYIWGIGGYVPGIPVLAIMVRYNLQSSGVVGHMGAFFWAVVAPWIFTAFFYQAQALLQFCSWVALLCQGFINLIAPILLYRQALLQYPTQAEEEVRQDRAAEKGSLDAPHKARVGGCALHGGCWNPLALVASLIPAEKCFLRESLLRPGGSGLESPEILKVMLQETECKVNLEPVTGDIKDSNGQSKEEAEAKGDEVDAVPHWVSKNPVVLATFMAWFVTVVVVVSTIMGSAS